MVLPDRVAAVAFRVPKSDQPWRLGREDRRPPRIEPPRDVNRDSGYARGAPVPGAATSAGQVALRFFRSSSSNPACCARDGRTPGAQSAKSGQKVQGNGQGQRRLAPATSSLDDSLP